MNEDGAAQQSSVEECAAHLGSAAQAMERVIGKLEAQYEALNQKIDCIIATIERDGEQGIAASSQTAQIEQENRELRQQAGRKTLAPMVSTLLAKSGVGEGVQMESGALEKALGALTIDQRIAVKTELARAGMIA